MFDPLTYEKGASLLRMLEQYLGTDRFRDGVRRYLRAHRYGNTETTDLWDAIESAAEGKPIRALMDSWIRQGGHPLVTAQRPRARCRARPDAVFLSARVATGRPARLRAPSARAGSSPWHSRGGRPAARPGAAVSTTSCLRDEPVRRPGRQRDARGQRRRERRLPAPLRQRAPRRHPRRLRPSRAVGAVQARRRHLGVRPGRLGAISSSSSPSSGASGARRTRAYGRWSRERSALLDFAVADADRDALEDFVQSLLRPELEDVGWDRRPDDDNDAARRRSILIGALGGLGADPAVRAECRERFAAARRGRRARRRHRLGHPARRGDHGRARRVRGAAGTVPLPRRPARRAALPRLAQLCAGPGAGGSDLRAVPGRDPHPGRPLPVAQAPPQPGRRCRYWDFVTDHWDRPPRPLPGELDPEDGRGARAFASWTRTARRGSRKRSPPSSRPTASAASSDRWTRAWNAWR